MLARILLVLLAAGVLADSAAGGDCGGTVPCRCGDTLTGSAQLPADLGPCEADGLVLRRAAALDCQGHTILGRIHDAVPGTGQKPPRTAGIILNRTRGAIVRNCKVTGFHYGIEFSEAHDSEVIGSETYRNGDTRRHVGYGIHLSRSVDNVVRQCHVHDNADEGIHVGSGSDRNTLIDNDARANFRENFYILAARGTRVLGNRAGGMVSANLYLKHATESRVEGNRFDDRPVLVRGHSSKNGFVDNVFGGGLKFEAYGDKTPAAPTENVVRGGRIAGPIPCLDFAEARNNRLEGVSLEGCRSITGRATAPAMNRVSSIDVKTVTFDLAGSASVQIATPVRVEVRTTGGRPISRARLELRDQRGEAHDAPTTDAAGTAHCRVPTHVADATGLHGLTPLVLTVSAKGHASARAIIKDPPPKMLRVVMTPLR